MILTIGGRLPTTVNTTYSSTVVVHITHTIHNTHNTIHTMQTHNRELVTAFEDIIDDYYREEIGALAERYPQNQETLTIEYDDVYRYDPDLARDYLAQPDKVQQYADEALTQYDLPIDVDLSGASMRLTDTRDAMPRRGLGTLKESDLGQLVAVRAQLGKVSERKARLKEGAFECERCGTITYVRQQFTESQEPHECESCERGGPFKLDEGMSEWVDQRKLKLESPPEKKNGAELIAYCLGELADPEGVNIQDKAGSRVTIIGKLEADMSSLFGRGEEPVADEYFVPEAFVWGDNLTNEIDVDDHREQVREYASRGDAIDLFARNIDPDLVVTGGWQQAIEMATVYLFGAPRINPSTGGTVRGDIHMLFVSDPGMNKSDFANKLADLSPKAMVKDAEGMSSSVSLTAAATQGGFGDDSWSIEPGALPKANDGHLILDEIDKGPDGFLNGIHSPLEGDQTLHIEKAGQEANLATRCGFLALGNPKEGTVDKYEPIAEQVDLHPALMSRFDLLCVMEDSPDRETDEAIARGVLDSIDESARLDHGDLEASDAEHVTGEVPRDVMKAWVKLARNEIHPLLSEDAKDALREFYVETRDMNGEESDTPPATARKLVGGIRISMAFARCELSETVTRRHAERAINLSKAVIGQNNLDPETGEFDANRTTETPSNQDNRVKSIRSVLINADEHMTPEAIAAHENVDADVQAVKHRLEKWNEAGEVTYNRVDGGREYRWI